MFNDWKLLAGKISDREVSKRFGIGSSTVRRYRLRHDITTYDPRNIDIPEALREQLGTRSNYQLAQDFKIPTTHIADLRAEIGVPEPKVFRAPFKPLEEGIWTAETLALLGTMPDPALADRLGVSSFPVKKKRHELGVAPYQTSYPEITAELAAEFGISSDRALATRLGVSASFIRRARLKWSENH
ncbi:hypothetical protein [Pseudomonas sp. N040]|uniref:hypothetical protein n=1 Tax=Pseudomonas sp. N040 TaxID=2785325 RepID=UPI0018A2F181|nr:hypothetical protein [Pseudomonas sp. N040]MBF7728610.1 hypothetical protein [Pseudomonas sp. N040]MBW7012250.1 hypothetical protein [Pseudomonas sp. N040]